jgi:hypothetical protein
LIAVDPSELIFAALVICTIFIFWPWKKTGEIETNDNNESEVRMENIKNILNGNLSDFAFLVLMRPINQMLFITYRSSKDPLFLFPVLCEITEDRYKVAEGYKITLRAIEPFTEQFGEEHFYQSDLRSLIANGSIRLFKEVGVK